jgi:hypothetical protein
LTAAIPGKTSLFLQHGWADNPKAIAQLGQQLQEPGMRLVNPDLGWWRTWWRFAPLRQHLEAIAEQEWEIHSLAQWRIVGHSMGGLLWLEVLNQRRDWWPRVHSLVLIGSPVGGADLARFIDPLGIGLGIARDLGLNRRPLAEMIAASIPTLVIAGDVDCRGSDGTIPRQSTYVNGAQFRCIDNLKHAQLKYAPQVAAEIRQFWRDPQCVAAAQGLRQDVIRFLQTVPGMIDTQSRHGQRGRAVLALPDNLTLYHWRSPLGVDHVFLATNQGECCFSGFVGWLHRQDLSEAIFSLERRYNGPRE